MKVSVEGIKPSRETITRREALTQKNMWLIESENKLARHTETECYNNARVQKNESKPMISENNHF